LVGYPIIVMDSDQKQLYQKKWGLTVDNEETDNETDTADKENQG